MKTMTCKQLGGACDKKFQASSFKVIGEMKYFFENMEREFEALPMIRNR